MKNVGTIIDKARAMFCQLGSMRQSKYLSRLITQKIYTTGMNCIITYTSECWRPNKSNVSHLYGFHNVCLRKMCNIFWPSTINNEKYHQWTTQNDFIVKIKEERFKWNGKIFKLGNRDITNIRLQWTPERRRRIVKPGATLFGPMVKAEDGNKKNKKEWRNVVKAKCVSAHQQDWG